MKKLITLLMVVSMSVMLLAGCGVKNTAGSADVKSIKKDATLAAMLPANLKTAGKILVGVDDSYPPMEFRDDSNNLVGFDKDLGDAIGKKLGVTMEWVPTKWDGILLALESSRFDMLLSSLSDTPDREKEILFSKPYIQGGPVLVVKKGTKGITTGADLSGKIVGVQTGTTGDDAVRAMAGVKEVKGYDKITDALMDLAIGRTDVVVADDQVGTYYVGLDSTKYEVVGKLAAEPFGIGFKKADTKLRDAVQGAIDSLKKDGVLTTISMKWFKADYYK